MSLAVCHARVLGRDRARTPSGQPVMVSTPVFDLAETSPVQAIAEAARKWRGVVPHHPHWQIIATYVVKPNTTVQVKDVETKKHRTARAQFDRVYIFEYIAERTLRQHFKIDDTCLDPMVDSWYLNRVEETTNAV
jgi:hypothetical protein